MSKAIDHCAGAPQGFSFSETDFNLMENFG